MSGKRVCPDGIAGAGQGARFWACSDRVWLFCFGCDAKRGRCVSKFYGAGSDDSTQGEHMESLLFFGACLSVTGPVCQRHHSILLRRIGRCCGITRHIQRTLPKSLLSPLGCWHWVQRAKSIASSGVRDERRTIWYVWPPQDVQAFPWTSRRMAPILPICFCIVVLLVPGCLSAVSLIGTPCTPAGLSVPSG